MKWSYLRLHACSVGGIQCDGRALFHYRHYILGSMDKSHITAMHASKDVTLQIATASFKAAVYQVSLFRVSA